MRLVKTFKGQQQTITEGGLGHDRQSDEDYEANGYVEKRKRTMLVREWQRRFYAIKDSHLFVASADPDVTGGKSGKQALSVGTQMKGKVYALRLPNRLQLHYQKTSGGVMPLAFVTLEDRFDDVVTLRVSGDYQIHYLYEKLLAYATNSNFHYALKASPAKRRPPLPNQLQSHDTMPSRLKTLSPMIARRSTSKSTTVDATSTYDEDDRFRSLLEERSSKSCTTKAKNIERAKRVNSNERFTDTAKASYDLNTTVFSRSTPHTTALPAVSEVDEVDEQLVTDIVTEKVSTPTFLKFNRINDDESPVNRLCDPVSFAFVRQTKPVSPPVPPTLTSWVDSDTVTVVEVDCSSSKSNVIAPTTAPSYSQAVASSVNNATKPIEASFIEELRQRLKQTTQESVATHIENTTALRTDENVNHDYEKAVDNDASLSHNSLTDHQQLASVKAESAPLPPRVSPSQLPQKEDESGAENEIGPRAVPSKPTTSAAITPIVPRPSGAFTHVYGTMAFRRDPPKQPLPNFASFSPAVPRFEQPTLLNTEASRSTFKPRSGSATDDKETTTKGRSSPPFLSQLHQSPHLKKTESVRETQTD